MRLRKSSRLSLKTLKRGRVFHASRIVLAALVISLISVSAVTGVGQPLDRSAGTLDPDGKTIWYDATTIGVMGQGFSADRLAKPYDRLPASAEGQVTPGVWTHSRHSAGLHIRFRATNHFSVRWKVDPNQLAFPHMPATGVSGVDVYYRNDGQNVFRFDYNGTPTGELNRLDVPLRHESVTYQVNFPLYNSVESLQIGIAADSQIIPMVEAEAPPVVFYGTSITQGGCASRPGAAHVALLRHWLGRPMINLGFSGSAKCEPEMAELLGEIEAALYVIDPGANMTPDLVWERLKPFILKLREKRPTTPIYVTDSDVYAQGEMAAAFSEVIKELQAAGDGNLYFSYAAGMLGNDGEGTVDGLHPTDLGFHRQAEFFKAAIEPILAK